MYILTRTSNNPPPRLNRTARAAWQVLARKLEGVATFLNTQQLQAAAAGSRRARWRLRARAFGEWRAVGLRTRRLDQSVVLSIMRLQVTCLGCCFLCVVGPSPSIANQSALAYRARILNEASYSTIDLYSLRLQTRALRWAYRTWYLDCHRAVTQTARAREQQAAAQAVRPTHHHRPLPPT